MGEGGKGKRFHRFARRSIRGRTLLHPFDSPRSLELPEESSEDSMGRVTTSRDFRRETLSGNRQAWGVRGITFGCSLKSKSIADPIPNMWIRANYGSVEGCRSLKAVVRCRLPPTIRIVDKIHTAWRTFWMNTLFGEPRLTVRRGWISVFRSVRLVVRVNPITCRAASFLSGFVYPVVRNNFCQNLRFT